MFRMAGYVIIAMLIWSAGLMANQIGEPRKPITPDLALLNLIVNLLIVAWVWSAMGGRG